MLSTANGSNEKLKFPVALLVFSSECYPTVHTIFILFFYEFEGAGAYEALTMNFEVLLQDGFFKAKI